MMSGTVLVQANLAFPKEPLKSALVASSPYTCHSARTLPCPSIPGTYVLIKNDHLVLTGGVVGTVVLKHAPVTPPAAAHTSATPTGAAARERETSQETGTMIRAKHRAESSLEHHSS